MNTESKRSDVEVQQNVVEALRADTRVEATNIGVEVDRGIVTLTGNVQDWAERTAAQEAAHRVPGVLDVANDIHVKPPGSAERTDADIARSIREALEWDVFLPNRKITTTVSNGIVTLEGMVENVSQREDAAEAVAHLPGVREVKNLLQLGPASPAVEAAKEAAKAPKRAHGFATMDRARVRELARSGGVAAHRKGSAHKFTSEEARLAGKKGGSAPHRSRGRAIPTTPPASGNSDNR